MIHWPCKRCAEGLEAPECLAGERLRCPKCKRLCRVPQAVQHHEAEVALVGAESSSLAVESINGSHDAAQVIESTFETEPAQAAEMPESPIDFAISRITDDVNVESSAPEVPDSLAAEELEVEPPAAAIDRLTLDAEVPALVEDAVNHSPGFAGEAEDHVETEIIIERVAVDAPSEQAEATIDELIADAVDQEMIEHPVTEHASVEAAVALAEDVAAPDRELTAEEVLEQSLEAVSPLIQRQLGPAVAQYSSREQARSAMFSRAVVDVYPSRLNVRSHEGNTLVLAVRYRRILRRTVVGTKNLPDMTVEAQFTNNAGNWTMDRWQRVLSV